MYITEPVDVLRNFIEARVSDLTRSGYSARVSQSTEDFDGDNSTDEFTLSASPISVVSVSVGGAVQTPYLDYNVDLDNKKVKFSTAPPSGTDNVSVTINTGTSWVIDNHNRSELTDETFPRIVVTAINESGNRIESGTTKTEDPVTFQIDILALKDMFVTVSGDTFEGPDVSTYLARQLIKELKDHFIADIGYFFRDFTILGNNDVPFEPDKNYFRRIVEINTTVQNNTIVE